MRVHWLHTEEISSLDGEENRFDVATTSVGDHSELMVGKKMIVVYIH